VAELIIGSSLIVAGCAAMWRIRTTARHDDPRYHDTSPLLTWAALIAVIAGGVAAATGGAVPAAAENNPPALNAFPPAGAAASYQVVYFVPQGSTAPDRSAMAYELAKIAQANYAAWGVNVTLEPDTIVLTGDHPEPVYARDIFTTQDEVHRKIGYDGWTIPIIFCECGVGPDAWGWANPDMALVGHLGFTAAITIHEIGHTLGLPHEDCTATNGPMCNGPTPQLSDHQRQLIFTRRCAWVTECAQPHATPTPAPTPPPPATPGSPTQPEAPSPNLYVQVKLEPLPS